MVSLSIKLAGKLLNCSRFRTAICVQLRSAKHYSTVQIKDDVEIDEFLNDKEYMHLKSEFIKPLPHDQRVLVVQPFIRKTAAERSPDLLLGMVLVNYFYEFQSIYFSLYKVSQVHWHANRFRIVQSFINSIPLVPFFNR